jgi:hypothetical protein
MKPPPHQDIPTALTIIAAYYTREKQGSEAENYDIFRA